MKTRISILVLLATANSWAASDIFWSGYHLSQGLSDGIYRADGDGGNARQIIPGDALVPPDYSYYVGQPMDLAIDAEHQQIYSISTEDDIIWKMDYAGTTFQEVHQVDGMDPHQFEVDFANQRIYWVEDNGSGNPARIGRCGLDGSNPTYIIADAGARAGGIALDAANGLVFWTESYYATEPKALAVWRCDVSGGNAEAIVTNFDETAFDLGSVAVDPEAQKVYWLQDHSLIRRADYDGANVETLYQENAIGDRSALVIDTTSDELFWTSLNNKSIGRGTLDGSSNGPLIDNLSSSPLAIALVSGGAVVVGAAPELRLGAVNPSTSSLTVAWTQTSGGWQLESSSSLSAGEWSAVPTNSISIDGTNRTAMVDLDQPGLFLRLRKTGP